VYTERPTCLRYPSFSQVDQVKKYRTLTTTILFVILTAFGALRLASFVVVFGEESLQMDFSAFYTAGESVNASLSPYENHYPKIWDGICWYRHSRFLYPPLVADLFRPFAAMPYHVAKYLWMLVSLACVAASIAIAFRAVGDELSPASRFAIAAFALFFHPLLVLLERGQVDAVTMLLVITSLFLICYSRRNFTAGLLLSLAVLLKLHTIYIVPFLLLRRKWRAIAGLAIGGMALLLVSLAVHGHDKLILYKAVELPRIAKYGEGGTAEMHMAPDIIQKLPYGGKKAVKNDRVYPYQALQFHAPATLVATPVGEAVDEALSSLGFDPVLSTVSLVILSGFVLLFMTWEIVTGFSRKFDHHENFGYWMLVLIVVLLSGPFTWVMNAVWLLPLSVFVLAEWKRVSSRTEAIGLAFLSFGLLWMAIPDHEILIAENVIAKLFMAAGLMFYTVACYRRPLPPPAVPSARPDSPPPV
jgi:hypothetical protein